MSRQLLLDTIERHRATLNRLTALCHSETVRPVDIQNRDSAARTLRDTLEKVWW